MSLLENAANSIRLGFEDFDSEDDDRLLSAARNLHAGVLLLYKEKLRRLSPEESEEVLLKKEIRPILDDKGSIKFVGKGKKTVDISQIKERFKSLNISVDWDKLDKVTNIRNDIEHYYTVASRDAVRGIISQSFLLFRDFVRGELQEDPRELLGVEAWSSMTEISDIYERERNECLIAIEQFEWTCSALQEAAGGTTCPQCSSALIEPKGNTKRPDVECRSCGVNIEFEEFAEYAMVKYYSGDNHFSVKEGGDPVTGICPICAVDAYHYESQICAVCEESVEHECMLCGSPIIPDELGDDELCGYCRNTCSKQD